MIKVKKNTRLTLISTLIISIFSICTEITYKFFLYDIKNIFSIDLFFIYSIIELSLITLCILIHHKLFWSGLVSFFYFKKNSNIQISFACIINYIYLLLSVMFNSEFQRKSLNIYSSIVVFSLLLYSYSNYINEERIKKNSNFLLYPVMKKSIKLIKHTGHVSNCSNICYSQRTTSFKNLNRLLYSEGIGEKVASSVSLISCFILTAVGVITFFINKDFIYAFSAVTVGSCMCIPIYLKIVPQIQLSKVCKRCIKSNAMISGFKTIKKFGEIHGVIINSTDLYPRLKITLQGIKTFNGEELAEAIICASAVVNAVNGSLKYVLSKIIKGRPLPTATNVIYESEKGLIGFVNGKRVLVGNRHLLSRYNITPPSHEYEKNHLINNRRITYFAIADKLVAMIVLSYTPNTEVKCEIKGLSNLGIHLFVRSVDSNITPELISSDFNIYYNLIKTVQDNQGIFTLNDIDRELKIDNAYAVTFGSIKSFFNIILYCVKAKAAIALGTIASIISLVFQFFLILFLIFYTTVDCIGSFELLLYFLIWTFFVCTIPEFLSYKRKER